MSGPNRAGTTRFARSKDGTSIAYSKIGAGPALILVDGALCHRGFGPSGPLAELLAPRFTVYTYDRRGRGESGDTAPYSAEREVEDIDAILAAAGGSAAIYGISSGAALALDATAKLPGLGKTAVYEAPFIVDDSAPPRPAALTTRMQELLARGRRGDVVSLFMKTVGTPAFIIFMMKLMPLWRQLESIAHSIPYDFAVLGETGSGRPLPKSRWAGISVPVLVMDGEKSPIWMRNAMRSTAETVPGARYLSLEGQNHMLKPEAVAPVLREFLLPPIAENGLGAGTAKRDETGRRPAPTAKLAEA
jgi:pimeloyl-ACP methyl ester carboxylesterase